MSTTKKAPSKSTKTKKATTRSTAGGTGKTKKTTTRTTANKSSSKTKVSSHIIRVAVPKKNATYGHASAVDALCQNGFRDVHGQYIPRRFGVRTGKAYDIVERESDGVYFVVKGTNQDRTVNISRFNGTAQDIE